MRRVSPGTAILHDLRSELDTPEFGLEPAAVIPSRVVSDPRSGRVTCDAGSKALAAEAGRPVAVALGYRDLIAAVPNEERQPCDSVGAKQPPVGTLLDPVPMRACPAVNLFTEALLLERGQTRVIAVAVRRHELFCDD